MRDVGLYALIAERLGNYPGAHPGENWKLETDLTKCTAREKQAIHDLGYTVEDFMAVGLNRGETSHILFGYRFPGRR